MSKHRILDTVVRHHGRGMAELDAKEMKEQLATALDGVEGWLHPLEAWQLHEAARLGRGSDPRPLVVEIGTWKGRSCVALALGVKARGDGRVFTIDPAEVSSDAEVPEPLADRVPELVANLERAGVRDIVEIIRSRSHEARSRFPDGTVSVLFVDGSHHYEDVVQDIHDWLPALADGAVVAFNDPGWEGVNRALREELARRPSPCRAPWFVVNTLFFRFSPTDPWRWDDWVRLARLGAFLRVKRGLERVYRRLTPGAPAWRVATIEIGAWGATRLLLPTSPADRR